MSVREATRRNEPAVEGIDGTVTEAGRAAGYETPEVFALGTANQLLKGVWRHYSDGANYTYIYKE